MTYREALAYLDSLVNYEKKGDFDYKNSFKLERMRSFADRLGNPQRKIRAFHIGGTKGKGSTASFINAVLMEAGYNVGLYTSPHLFSFRERIRVNGEPIGEDEVVSVMSELAPHMEEMEKCEYGRPTYFEVCTMMSFLYFLRRGIDFMVLEVGMGGRLDSTNIIDTSVAVITPISYDHTRYLGSSLCDIAFEKSGIIKSRSIVVSASQQPEAMEVIRRAVFEKGARLYEISKDIFFEIFHSDTESQRFRLITPSGEYPELTIRLLGAFQVENAATAVGAIEAIRLDGIFIDADIIKRGLARAKWPGRLHLLRYRPYVVVDGAHNQHSLSILFSAVKNIFGYKRLFLVFGIMFDKDITGACNAIDRGISRIIATKSKSERATPPELVREILLKSNRRAHVTVAHSVAEAVAAAMAEARSDDLILITGSLYVATEAMETLGYGS